MALRYSPRRIYVASSWRTPQQPAVVERLRAEGHEVYDFRNPAGRTGFGWRQATDEPPPWSAERTREVLALPISQAGFDSDFDAMKWADTLVMLQPSGRSAALELGWACGARKLTMVLLADGQEPELMLKCARCLCTSLDEVCDLLRRYDPVRLDFDALPVVVRYRHRETGEVRELRAGAIGGVLRLVNSDGHSEVFAPGDAQWERVSS